MAPKKLRIELVRGLAGKNYRQIETVKGLGLRRRHQVVEKPDTPSIRGQIEKVAHLVRVREVA